MFTLTSNAFGNGETIPVRFTCDGEDLPPPLEWSGAPAATKAFALVCSDPDAPHGTFYHWAIFDIPADMQRLPGHLPAGDPEGPREALNDFRKPGYGGPCPPKGHGPHRYHFRLYALDTAKLDLPQNAACRDVEQAAKAHTLAETELTGAYQR